MKQKMKLKKRKSRIVNFGIVDKVFNRYFDVYYGDRVECANKIKKTYKLKENTEDFLPNVAAETMMISQDDGGNKIIVLWFSENNIEHICHEIFHATYMALETVGIKLSDETNETFAYYVGFLCKEIISTFTRKRIKKYGLV